MRSVSRQNEPAAPGPVRRRARLGHQAHACGGRRNRTRFRTARPQATNTATSPNPAVSRATRRSRAIAPIGQLVERDDLADGQAGLGCGHGTLEGGLQRGRISVGAHVQIPDDLVRALCQRVVQDGRYGGADPIDVRIRDDADDLDRRRIVVPDPPSNRIRAIR
jgi:hypothetical protein